ncbi:MAG: hypothetical protein U0798_08035 [Gemmataceae bacterium]
MAADEETLDGWLFQCEMNQLWECVGQIPTGAIVPISRDQDFRQEKQLGQTQFDTLLTRLPSAAGLQPLATLRHPVQPGVLTIRADETFPHIVLFTPTHRRSLAIEPYTCATNAAQMPQTAPSGWRILATGAKMKHLVEYSWVL